MENLPTEITNGIIALIGIIVGWLTKWLQHRGKEKDLKEIITKQHETISKISQIKNQR